MRQQIVTVVATIILLAINGLANGLPLNGQQTGEISNRFDVYFVPAGYVFSIWGIIYAGVIAFTIYQALPSKRTNPALGRIRYLYAISCLANVVWLFLWHYEYFVLSLAAMLVLLLALIAIYLRLDIGRERPSPAGQWCVHVPFSLYLGWITVATIANVTIVLDYIRWSGWGILPEYWAVIVLALGVGVAWVVRFQRQDVAYLAVLIWAFAGIAVKQSATQIVSGAAWLAAILVAIAVADALRTRRHPATSSSGR